VSKKGRTIPGRRMVPGYVGALLRNPAYVAKVRLDGELYPAEHKAIISQDVFDRAQALLASNGTTGGREARNKHGALLKGLLFCAPCDAPMAATHTSKAGRLYRYYLCRKAREEGWAAC